jgi:phage FluMu gp28-like protein
MTTQIPDFARQIRADVRMQKARQTAQTTIPLYPEQQSIFDSRKRFKIAVCGRRFGKTHAGMKEAITCAANGGRVWWIAPSYAQAMEGYRYIKLHLMDTPGIRIRESEYLIYFPSGGEIQVKTGDDPMKKKGAGLNLVVLDEAALLDPILWYEVIRPSLADKKGSALFLSTPKGRNWFFLLYQEAVQNPTEWDVFAFPSSANPVMTSEELEAIRASTPEMTFRQEYLAEFLEDDGAVFRKLKEAQDKYKATGAHYSGRCVMGVDWAQMHDFTVIVVMDMTSKRVLEIERFNQVSWGIQRGRLEALYRKWKPENILAELNSIGSPNVEALQEDGLPVEGFTTTNETKTQIIQALSLAFEREEIPLPDEPILIGELMSYAAERLPSGKWRYSAPDGMHDDTVIALALAYWAAVNTMNTEYEPMPDWLAYARG